MIFSGTITAESPLYRGNSRKTLFTRDGDGKERLVSLAGEVSGTAQSLMDAFIGESRNGKNKGLINKLWHRLYGDDIPKGLITRASCNLKEECYSKDNFFDLRMGLKLDEDRMASESGKNYKYETVFRNSEFDFKLDVNMELFKQDGNGPKLLCVFDEMKSGRFWYGAGKSKGLGRCKLTFDANFPKLPKYPAMNSKINHMTFKMSFDAQQPLLVGWNWGKVDPVNQDFITIEGKYLIDGMRMFPRSVRNRLSSMHGGSISDLSSWKKSVIDSIPSILSYWFSESENAPDKKYVIRQQDIKKLTQGKFPLSKKVIENLTGFIDTYYNDRESLESEFKNKLGDKDARKNRRILDLIKQESVDDNEFSDEKYKVIERIFSISEEEKSTVASIYNDKEKLSDFFIKLMPAIKADINLQVDQQAKLIQSDPWVEDEIEVRYEHIKIKEMLLKREIDESQWGNFRLVPKGVSAISWRDFLQSHDGISYHHMLNANNLKKSITNDKNIIEFLRNHKIKAHQELSQPHHIDYRGGGNSGSNVSKEYGKPYDTIFMRMLSWSKKDGETRWEVYIPGSTIKGAFRKRATQVLSALFSNDKKVSEVINALFGAQRRAGLIKFSDAYPSSQDFSRTVWCSMDSIQIDPLTGRPTDQAKSDYLYAYGQGLKFSFRIDLEDISDHDLFLLKTLLSLIDDFSNGDIALGGDKTNGMGWVKGTPEACDWLFIDDKSLLHKELFSNNHVSNEGFWNHINISNSNLSSWVDQHKGINSLITSPENKILPLTIMQEGYVSHKSIGGFCGELVLTGELLTPLHIQESGEPSFKEKCHGRFINGWDQFSMSSPENEIRPSDRQYSIPSRTVRGAIRQMYTLATESFRAAKSLSSLNPAERLFGWVGDGQNQALMGRISFGFAHFTNPDLSWYSAPTSYGEWYFDGKDWQQNGDYISPTIYANECRVYPHCVTSPCIKKIAGFTPDNPNLSYFRAVNQGSKFELSIKFWNLEESEFNNLLWCILLEDNLAHKLGKYKQLGMGSVRFLLNQDKSYLIDFVAKYKNKDYKMAIDLDKALSGSKISNYHDLVKFIDANSI